MSTMQVGKESEKVHAVLLDVRKVLCEIRSCNTYARTSSYGNYLIFLLILICFTYFGVLTAVRSILGSHVYSEKCME